MKEEIRPYYNLSVPEQVAVFPMWHRCRKLNDEFEALILASPTPFKEGTIFSYVTGYGAVYLEMDSEISKEFHPGRFPSTTTQDIFLFILKCRRTGHVTYSSKCGKNEIMYLNPNTKCQ